MRTERANENGMEESAYFTDAPALAFFRKVKGLVELLCLKRRIQMDFVMLSG